MGSNMAENHPVGFQWVVEARERGAEVIHVDPRFTRTSAMATRHVGIRAGSDIAFLGGIVNYILAHGREFRDYVVNYTNAPVIINPDFKDTEDLDGFFSGWKEETGGYDNTTWQYQGAEEQAAAGERDPSATGEQAHGAHGGGDLEHGDSRLVREPFPVAVAGVLDDRAVEPFPAPDPVRLEFLLGIEERQVALADAQGGQLALAHESVHALLELNPLLGREFSGIAAFVEDFLELHHQ
jgi:hypothetical protein